MHAEGSTANQSPLCAEERALDARESSVKPLAEFNALNIAIDFLSESSFSFFQFETNITILKTLVVRASE
jgi:hypothetical protein